MAKASDFANTVEVANPPELNGLIDAEALIKKTIGLIGRTDYKYNVEVKGIVKNNIRTLATMVRELRDNAS